MDKDFQTSFIPKKPLAEERVVRERPVNIFSFFATVIFFASLVSGAGVYFYKIVLTRQVAEMNTSLERAKEAFEPGLILDLQNLDKRLNSSKEILANHLVLSPLFKTLQDLTLKSVRFTKFDYSALSEQGISIKLSGQARSYTSVALQSDALAKNKYIKDPVFSNLNLDDRGNVTFDLSFMVDPSFLRYQSLASNNQ
ncbi:MAG: hypothetical protein WC795_01165 [Candidatus Paceibacterota bacterium]|jgi:hypothetical protein